MIVEQGLTERELGHNGSLYEEFAKYDYENGWPAARFQIENFDELIKIAQICDTPLIGASCLEVGCGTGDFSAYLRKLGIKDYLGLDIYPPALDQARSRYPSERFEKRDLLAEPLEERFSFSFSSGGLSTRFPDRDNYDFLRAMLQRMWAVTDLGLAFNYLTPVRGYGEDKYVFNYEDGRVEEICMNLPEVKKVEIRSQVIFILGYSVVHQSNAYIVRV